MKENVSLKNLTTIKVGGTAKYFFAAKTEEEIKRAAAFAAARKLPIFVLGGGSNVLVSDEGFSGVVIKIETEGISYDPPAGEAGEKRGARFARASSGVSWDFLVADTVSHGLWGLENLSGIPGTVGAAPIQNIGAYGAEVCNVIESVRTLDIETGKEKIFSNSECKFAYRNSFLKTAEGKKYIILEVTFKLSKDPKPNISYKDLQEYFGAQKNGRQFLAWALRSDSALETAAHFSASDVRQAVLQIRSKKFPDLSKVGTAGSFFKNPIISEADFEKLKSKYPETPFFAAKNGLPTGQAGVKIPLAFILDKICGLKGFKKGNVELFQNQPLVLINTGGATAKEISDFSAAIKKVVKEKTGIDIEEEVVCI